MDLKIVALLVVSCLFAQAFGGKAHGDGKGAAKGVHTLAADKAHGKGDHAGKGTDTLSAHGAHGGGAGDHAGKGTDTLAAHGAHDGGAGDHAAKGTDTLSAGGAHGDGAGKDVDTLAGDAAPAGAQHAPQSQRFCKDKLGFPQLCSRSNG